MQRKSSRSFFYRLLTLSLLLPLLPLTSHAVSAQTPHTGVIIPLYSYPGNAWNTIIQAKLANPSVPIIAVVNPNNGPGASRDTNYGAWIGKLHAAGIVVLGYVYTSYSSRSTSAIETDMNSYKTWYGVQGIFFDEMSNVVGKQTYYSALNSYATSKGFTFTVGNPGSVVPSAFVGSVDCIIIYENSGTPTLSGLATASMGMSKTNFAFIAYDSSLSSSSYIASSSSYVSYVYLTDGTMPNPYSSLPSYFASLVAELNAPSTVNFAVQSIGPTGQPLVGMWTTVSSGGKVLATGFTPLSFTGNIGQQYTVTVANYANYYFAHWESGSRNSTRVFTLNSQTTLTAYYASLPQQYGTRRPESSGGPTQLQAPSGGISLSTYLWREKA